jgi:hypothetical protein
MPKWYGLQGLIIIIIIVWRCHAAQVLLCAAADLINLQQHIDEA